MTFQKEKVTRIKAPSSTTDMRYVIDPASVSIGDRAYMKHDVDLASVSTEYYFGDSHDMSSLPLIFSG